jgi:hypothetical protein
MIKKLLAIALVGLLPLTAASTVYAEDPPSDSGVTAAPEDPDAQPYPPDGVTDPNTPYMTDDSANKGAGDGEAGGEPSADPQAEPPAEPPAGDAPADAPPDAPADPPADPPADAPPADAPPPD